MKKLVKIKNLRSGAVLADKCTLANSSLSRLVGLLNHANLPQGEGMLLEPCNNIHTFFMRFPIDVVFLNSENKVLAWGEYKPWRMSKLHLRARRVLEMPVGTCREQGLEVGDRLEIEACFN